MGIIDRLKRKKTKVSSDVLNIPQMNPLERLTRNKSKANLKALSVEEVKRLVLSASMNGSPRRAAEYLLKNGVDYRQLRTRGLEMESLYLITFRPGGVHLWPAVRYLGFPAGVVYNWNMGGTIGLYHADYPLKEIKDVGGDLRSLLSLGGINTARIIELKKAGYKAVDFRSIDLGYYRAPGTPPTVSLRLLLRAFSLRDLLRGGYKAKNFIDENFSQEEMLRMFPVVDLVKGGYSASIFRKAGVEARKLISCFSLIDKKRQDILPES